MGCWRQGGKYFVSLEQNLGNKLEHARRVVRQRGVWTRFFVCITRPYVFFIFYLCVRCATYSPVDIFVDILRTLTFCSLEARTILMFTLCGL